MQREREARLDKSHWHFLQAFLAADCQESEMLSMLKRQTLNCWTPLDQVYNCKLQLSEEACSCDLRKVVRHAALLRHF